jgi:osmotically-inducible protein OsmY
MNSKTIICRIILTVALPLVIRGGSSFAGAGSGTDQSVQTAIEERLNRQGLLKGNSINVIVEDNSIILSGTVSSLFEVSKAEHEARDVGDNFKIVNRLAATPVATSDEDLANSVAKRLRENVFFSIFDWVNLDVTKGQVTLTGWVYEPWHKRQFEHQAERVVGVSKISNEIQVESGCLFDDEMRNKAARIVYDDPFFAPINGVRTPTVHIVVNEGVVTLEGEVETTHERSWAQNTISMNTGALQIINHLQVEGKSRAQK